MMTRKGFIGGVLAAIVGSRAQAQGGTATGGKDRTPPNPAAGAEPYRDVPQLGRLRDQVLYGDVWKQPELTPHDRSLVTCAVLAALGRDAELASHVRRAVENGVSPDQFRGMAVQLAFYAGWPAGLSVARAAHPFLQPPR